MTDKEFKRFEEILKFRFKTDDLNKLNIGHWNTILSDYSPPFEFLEKFLTVELAELILEKYILTEEQLNKVIDVQGGIKNLTRQAIRGLLLKQALSETFLTENIDIFKDNTDYKGYLSKNQKLSENFMEKHPEVLDWNTIAKYQRLSEKFLERHLDKFWPEIFKYQNVSDSFLENTAVPFYKEQYKDNPDNLRYHLTALFSSAIKNGNFSAGTLKRLIKNNLGIMDFSDILEYIVSHMKVNEEYKRFLIKTVNEYSEVLYLKKMRVIFLLLYTLSNLENENINEKHIVNILNNYIKKRKDMSVPESLMFPPNYEKIVKTGINYLFDFKSYEIYASFMKLLKSLNDTDKKFLIKTVLNGNKRKLTASLKELDFTNLKENIEKSVKNKDLAVKMLTNTLVEFYSDYADLLGTDVQKLLPKDLMAKIKTKTVTR